MMPYAPVLLLAVAGWFVLWRRERRLAIELAITVIPYMIATTHLRMWWGGWSAPARFSVAVLWLASLPIAAAWSHARSRAARGTALAALLVSAFTTIALAAVDGGRLAYNVRDGYSMWFQRLSPLGDLPLGLPSFFRWFGVEWALHAQVAVSLALFVGGFLLLRAIERRVQGTGSFRLVSMAVYALAAMAMLTILWRVNDATGLRPTAAQLRLLRAAQGERRIALQYANSVSTTSVDSAVQRLRIQSPPRMLGGPEPPALVLPGWFPAGRYRIDVQGAPAAAYELRILRTGTPVLTGTLPSDRGTMAIDLSLPVDVPAVILQGPALQEATLAPVHVATRRERFGEARASSARRYGSAVVWFLDGHAFNEPEGLWVRGGVPSELLLQPDGDGPVTVMLRNGPMDNTVELRAGEGEWTDTVTLRPGEERDVRVPVDAARRAAWLQVYSKNGFRPSEVDRGSTDTRFLGVWLEPR
jgi:hypothetical protein